MTDRVVPYRGRVVAALAAAAILASSAVTLSDRASATTTRPGIVRVLSAGSLSNVMMLLGAAFKSDTGYALENTSMGSSALASGIKATTLQGDVFISASYQADQSLEGPTNGRWIDGYTNLGTSPVMLAYFRGSRFAAALRTRPWYDVITSPGFELGRTNPAVDPGGVLDLDALNGLGYAYNLPQLLALTHVARDVYTEEALPGLLQAGQLDAAFMYAVSADAAKLPHVALLGTRNLDAHYTVAQVKNAPDPATATAFVRWLLSAHATSIMVRQGLVPAKNARFVPAAT